MPIIEYKSTINIHTHCLCQHNIYTIYQFIIIQYVVYMITLYVVYTILSYIKRFPANTKYKSTKE